MFTCCKNWRNRIIILRTPQQQSTKQIRHHFRNERRNSKSAITLRAPIFQAEKRRKAKRSAFNPQRTGHKSRQIRLVRKLPPIRQPLLQAHPPPRLLLRLQGSPHPPPRGCQPNQPGQGIPKGFPRACGARCLAHF